jgi:1-acyl-sn-glycerol-3-phosphate acyltransferase
MPKEVRASGNCGKFDIPGLRPVWYWLVQWSCRVFCMGFFGFRAYGTKNVPEGGGVILASNHQSFLDPIFCGVALRRHLHFVARDSLFRNGFFALLIRSLNAIPVKRDKPDVSSIKTVIAGLKQGNSVCLFPEATRTSDGRIRAFKPGFGLLCRQADVPVVPVLIDGAFECWPRHKKVFSPAHVTVCYGQAITAEQAKKMSDRELAELVTSRLRRMQDICRLKRGKKPYRNYPD